MPCAPASANAGTIADPINGTAASLGIGGSWLDVKLGLRMLFKYKGLSLAGGLALAIAIGLGAAWYDVVSDQLHPRLPLPEGDRIVEVEMHNVATSQGERRVLHDLLNWRRDVRSIEELGAYRTLERNLILGDARPEEVVGRGDHGVGVPARRGCRRCSAGRCSMPTNSLGRPRSSCSGTACGSGASADAPTPSGRRYSSDGPVRRSSASCPRVSRFP